MLETRMYPREPLSITSAGLRPGCTVHTVIARDGTMWTCEEAYGRCSAWTQLPTLPPMPAFEGYDDEDDYPY